MEKKASAAERLAAQLRVDMLAGNLPPGHRLKEEELADQFRTGRYTVRSALRMLADAGLVDHRANRGAVVPVLSRARVDEVWDCREVFELGALRLALGRSADLTAVVDTTRALQQLPDHAPWVEVVETHQRIHHELVAAAGNNKLLMAYTQCEEELRYVVSVVRPTHTARRLAELHTRLLHGIQSGGDGALKALEQDLSTGRAAVLAALGDGLAA